MITIDDFGKVEIRVGTVLEVTKVPEADRLLKIIFDFGPLEAEQHAVDGDQPEPRETMVLSEVAEASKYPGRHTRQIMSAIAPFFEDPQVLIGKQICVVTNLEPRKFRGYESQGMIMAVGDAETGITFISPENQVPAGMKVH